ncbi:hypothetical protein CYLTODRAFT_492610 [Cylindrobasidium torrendii FP15055 ss-10]|uniref:F-box domain-containing protein n=1 Tax=Cylindrobasidium torrendii FP15055 ss-10 TaxID=1314674 RepID=A0A0D7B690_9AGAR|nr:hypothetical protein CYLTODRAFT_492610 [Cylindrobasidium torrendii FP15055 ss-10]
MSSGSEIYNAMPDELKLQVQHWTYLLIYDMLKDRVRRKVREGTAAGSTAAAAMYDYIYALGEDEVRRVVLRLVCFRDGDRLSSFCQSSADTPGVRNAVVSLKLVGVGRAGSSGVDWKGLVAARPRLHHLKCVVLSHMTISNNHLASVVVGVEDLCIQRCQLSLSALAAAIAGVRKFTASANTLSDLDEPIMHTFNLRELELTARVRGEALGYMRILARVLGVARLVVVDVQDGWTLGGGWAAVTNLICIRGLPSVLHVMPSLLTLSAVVTVSSVGSLVQHLGRNCYARLLIIVEIPVGGTPQPFEHMWRVLDQCPSKVVHVQFNMVKWPPLTICYDKWSWSKTVMDFMKSNELNGDTLCPDALITVVRDRGRRAK